MKNAKQKSAYLVAAVLTLFLLTTSPLAAQQTTANFDLNGVGSQNVLAGVYTSPYTGSINYGSTVNVICDDFSDESYVPEDWTAWETSLSSITSGTDLYTSVLKWQGSYDGLDQAGAYEAAAVLSVDILTSTTVMQQNDYSFALWGLFDPTDAFGAISGNQYSADLVNPQSYLSTAVAAVKAGTVNLSNYDVTIYSYDNGAHGACGSVCSQPQEFITVTAVAEPPAPALLGVDLLSLAGLILLARRYGRLARVS